MNCSCANAGAVPATAADKEVRVGYQKYGTLVLLKGKGLLEEKLKPLGYTVKWAEFPSGSGQWQVKVMPLKLRSSAAEANSSGVP